MLNKIMVNTEFCEKKTKYQSSVIEKAPSLKSSFNITMLIGEKDKDMHYRYNITNVS